MQAMERLLRPKSIAVVGGGAWCENVIRECRKTGFRGEICAVHPNRTELSGSPVVRSVCELPFVPDAVFVGVNRHATVEVVRQLSKIGSGGAVCFASGFREAAKELEDSSSLQDSLVDAAGGMPFLGPNCYGFINAIDGAALWPDQHGLTKVSKGVAILTQSSNIALNLTMQTRGLPIAYLMTVGNQAQTGLSAVAEALLDDERVTAIGLHIEGLDDLFAFEKFTRMAQEVGKPIVVLKVGRSDQARAATVSHTASLAGSAVGARALFARLGLAQVDSLSALLETLKFLHVVGRLGNNSIASMSCSGGEASLIADVALDRKVFFPRLTPFQQGALNEVLGDKVALANPLDYHTYIWSDVEAMGQVFALMMAGEASFGLVVLDFPRSDRCSPVEWLKVIDAVEVAIKKSGKPIGILSSLPETMPEPVAFELLERGIVPLCGMEDAMTAIAASADLGRSPSREPIAKPVALKNPVNVSEARAKALLGAHGLRIPESIVATDLESTVRAAERIGFPVVLKGDGFAHKSEAGAVALNLRSRDEILTAAGRMPAETFLVEEMVTGVVAELLVGVVQDQAHGYVLTLAAGGVLTELLQDSASLILPVSREDVAAALDQLKISRVLSGFRGQPACDREAIIDAVLSVQAFALSTPVSEVEVNPLLCGENFAIAADALIRCEETKDG
ncbi:acetate--CoA ligase family protein [Roseibium sp. MMSF_3544]|uniref:acetate--CoA ligase family protein n=1 Tax=unclassified Roseibium TaxID=2629323 RepID=UPI00273EDF1A|nr:acetate--CoA ligase family protein [Roseibium sp. MMSF_3544]